MTDPMTILAALRRPRLLIDAAHLGVAEYRRGHMLARLLADDDAPDAPPEGASAFQRLAAHEATMNAERQTGGATYSVARHIEVLAAMIAEARGMARTPA